MFELHRTILRRWLKKQKFYKQELFEHQEPAKSLLTLGLKMFLQYRRCKKVTLLKIKMR